MARALARQNGELARTALPEGEVIGTERRTRLARATAAPCGSWLPLRSGVTRVIIADFSIWYAEMITHVSLALYTRQPSGALLCPFLSPGDAPVPAAHELEVP